MKSSRDQLRSLGLVFFLLALVFALTGRLTVAIPFACVGFVFVMSPSRRDGDADRQRR